MDENKFWDYISMIDSYPRPFHNKYDKEECQTRLIKNQLLKKNTYKEVLEFDIIYNEKLNDLWLPKIVELQMVNQLSFEELQKENLYVSNDGFRDFRNYIVGRGRKEFELIKDFKTEDEIFHIDFHVNIAYRSDLEFLVDELIETHYSKQDNKEEVKSLHDNNMVRTFPDFKDVTGQIDWKSLDKKYPKMITKTLIENSK
jgi:hypothetical protein